MTPAATVIPDSNDPSAPDHALTEEDFAVAVAIAANLFPDEAAAADPCTCLEAVLAERIELSENIHWLANETASPALHVLADAVAPPALHALVAAHATYVAYRPFAAFIVGPIETVAAELRAATRAVLVAKPGSVLELATKLRFSCLVGLHARLRRQFPQSGAKAAAEYDRLIEHLNRLPNWLIVGFFLRHLAPEWINRLEAPQNKDEALTLDLIREAGPSWEAAIAADVERVLAAGAGQAK